MRRPQGYAVKTEPDGATVEMDTFTCRHCNTIVFVKPMQDASECGGFCGMCHGHVCGPCNAKRECTPFEKVLEKMEGRDRLRRSIIG